MILQVLKVLVELWIEGIEFDEVINLTNHATKKKHTEDGRYSYLLIDGSTNDGPKEMKNIKMVFSEVTFAAVIGEQLMVRFCRLKHTVVRVENDLAQVVQEFFEYPTRVNSCLCLSKLIHVKYLKLVPQLRLTHLVEEG